MFRPSHPQKAMLWSRALQTLRNARLEAGASHLRNASECIHAGDWAGSVRESIHAVESVARQLDPQASRNLKRALQSLDKRKALHPALKEAFNKLYGYTSDEQGVRHASLDRAGHDSSSTVSPEVRRLKSNEINNLGVVQSDHSLECSGKLWTMNSKKYSISPWNNSP